MAGRKPILRRVTLTATFAPLFSDPIIGRVMITALPTNKGPVYALGDDGSELPLAPGEELEFFGVCLHAIKMRCDKTAKGNAVADAVLIVGET